MQRLHRQLCAASSKHQATVSPASALATVRRCCKAEARCTQPSRGHADCSRSCSLHTASVCPGQTHELVAEARASTCTLSIAASAPRPGTLGCGLRRDGARIRAGRAHAGHIGNQDLLPRTRRQGLGPPAAFHRLMPARAHVRHAGGGGRQCGVGRMCWCPSRVSGRSVTRVRFGVWPSAEQAADLGNPKLERPLGQSGPSRTGSDRVLPRGRRRATAIRSGDGGRCRRVALPRAVGPRRSASATASTIHSIQACRPAPRRPAPRRPSF